MILAYGHYFRDFKTVEMICSKCGFVIWRVTTTEAAEDAVRSLKDGDPAIYCGKRWHHQITLDNFCQLAGQPRQLLRNSDGGER